MWESGQRCLEYQGSISRGLGKKMYSEIVVTVGGVYLSEALIGLINCVHNRTSVFLYLRAFSMFWKKGHTEGMFTSQSVHIRSS